MIAPIVVPANASALDAAEGRPSAGNRLGNG